MSFISTVYKLNSVENSLMNKNKNIWEFDFLNTLYNHNE